MKKKKPNKTQQLLIDLIKEYQKMYKEDPTVEGLAKALNASVPSIYARLMILRKSGFIPKKTCLKNPNHYKINYLKKERPQKKDWMRSYVKNL